MFAKISLRENHNHRGIIDALLQKVDMYQADLANNLWDWFMEGTFINLFTVDVVQIQKRATCMLMSIVKNPYSPDDQDRSSLR